MRLSVSTSVMLFLHHLVTLEDEWYVVCTIFEYIVCPSTYSYRDYQLYDRSAKIDFLLETIIVTKVTFSKNVIIAAMGQQTLGLEDTRVG